MRTHHASTEGLLCQSERLTATHYRILWMAWAGWIFDFYDLMLYSFLLIEIGREFHLSHLGLSYILGASLSATAVGGVLAGWLSDRFGRKKVLSWTLLTYSAGMLWCGLSSGLLALVVGRTITGIGVGGEWATGQTYIGETFPAKARGRYAGLLQAGAPVGVALAALVGGLLSPRIGWRWCFLLSALPALLVLVIRRWLPESDLWLAHGRSAGAKTGWGGEELRLLFSDKFRLLFINSLLLAVFGMSAYWFTYSWMPNYLYEKGGLSLTRSTGWIVFTQVGSLLGYASFGWVADHFGRRPAFTLYGVVMAFGLFMITIAWEQIHDWPFLILGCMYFVGFGTGFFSGYGPLYSELFPTSVRNTAMGAAFNLARGVQFFTPVVITLVARAYGLAGGISLAILFALLVSAWAWTFPETKGRVLVEP